MTDRRAVMETMAGERTAPASAGGLRLDREGRDWPHRGASRMVRAGTAWHVQDMGHGPVVLLVHGTGASTHSFAGLAAELSGNFRVVALDLPGHGFSEPLPPGRMTLPGIASAIGVLLDRLDVVPDVAVGHSAGAAILLRMCIDGRIRPKVVVSLNGALKGFRGPLGKVFSPLAQLLAANPLVPRLFARRARDEAVIDGLVGRTGSRIGPREVGFYRRLAADPHHVRAALTMMAGWDLGGLARDLPRLVTPVVLVAGSRDGMVPADQAFELARSIADAQVRILHGLGHLAHEEAPAQVARLVEAAAVERGVVPEPRP